MALLGEPTPSFSLASETGAYQRMQPSARRICHLRPWRGLTGDEWRYDATEHIEYAYRSPTIAPLLGSSWKAAARTELIDDVGNRLGRVQSQMAGACPCEGGGMAAATGNPSGEA